jgi:hypothetical protein
VRLDEAVAGATQLLGEQPEQDVLHARMAPLKDREVVAEDRARLAVLERRDGGRPLRVGEQQRELAEGLARPEHVEEHGVARGRRDPCSEPASRNQMQRVRGVVAMEHDLPLVERPPARDREQLPNVLLFEVRQ